MARTPRSSIDTDSLLTVALRGELSEAQAAELASADSAAMKLVQLALARRIAE